MASGVLNSLAEGVGSLLLIVEAFGAAVAGLYDDIIQKQARSSRSVGRAMRPYVEGVSCAGLPGAEFKMCCIIFLA